MARMRPKTKACSFGDDKVTTPARAVRGPRQRRNTASARSKSGRCSVPRRIDDETVKKIAAYLKEQKRAGLRPVAADVIKELGLQVSPAFVRQIARGALVRLSPGGRPNGAKDKAPRHRQSTEGQILQLHAEGLQPADIALATKRTPALVYHYLKKNSLTPNARPPTDGEGK